MDNNKAIATLRRIVKDDIRYLCRRADVFWNAPIVQTLRDLRDCGGRSVFFGGVVRSLVLSRLLKGSLGRPRDVDIVVNEISIEGLRQRFSSLISRETRFGGLQLLRSDWHFDIWPLHRTWAFIKDNNEHPRFDELPRTTFFNLEAIAVEVWPTPGASRVIFSGDGQFFEGVLTRTLELNREENPFPALCVVRALVLAARMDLAIGPNLASYLTRHSDEVTDDELVKVQLKHYGTIRVNPETARNWLHHIRRSTDYVQAGRVQLPLFRQGTLWPDEDTWPMLRRLIDSSREVDDTKLAEVNHADTE